MKTLTRLFSFLQIILWAFVLYASVFSVDFTLFNGLVSAKQKAFEIFSPLLFLTLPLVYALKKQWKITVIDVLVLLFAIYMLFWEAIVLKSPYLSLVDSSYPILLFLAVYYTLRSIKHTTIFLWGILIVFLIISSAQAIYGLMQLYAFKNSYHGLFAITGSFHNPGPFSGFVVCGLPLALSIISYQALANNKRFEVRSFKFKSKQHRTVNLEHKTLNLEQSPTNKYGVRSLELRSWREYLIQILAWITLVLILLVLPPAQSRAAWIAGIVGCSYVLLRQPILLTVWKKWCSKYLKIRKPLRILILSLVLSAFIAGSFGLYFMKKGSADGRWLIWQVTAELIKEKPVKGFGVGSFDAKYMDAQAEWFAMKKETSVRSMVAGSPEAPFNELLKLWLERGLIAILLMASLLYFIFTPSKQSGQKQQYKLINSELTTTFQGTAISILSFSLFSYPFDLTPFILVLITLLAVSASFKKAIIKISSPKLRWSAIPIFLLLASCTLYINTQRKDYYQALTVWQKANQFYNIGNYKTSVETYQEAYHILEDKGLFLQMYAKALSMDEEYKKSNEILAEAQRYKSSQIIQNTLGDNYKALGNFEKAEEAYIKSSQMIPSLLLPKYLLTKLYDESDQQHKAYQAAKEILNSEIKVESTATKEIIDYAKMIVEKNNEQSSMIRNE